MLSVSQTVSGLFDGVSRGCSDGGLVRWRFEVFEERAVTLSFLIENELYFNYKSKSRFTYHVD